MPDHILSVLQSHLSRYPQMEPQDFGKLAYQHAFGPEHLISSPEQVLEGIGKERAALCPDSASHEREQIGNGLCRFPLSALKDELDEALLAKLFFLTAREHTGSRALLDESLTLLEALPVPGMTKWLSDYRAKGCPPVSHSETYRMAYRPHYRLLREEYACYFPVLSAISHFLRKRGSALISIDGRCGSGKTMLSLLISQVFDCNVLHIDDYYLPLDRRRSDWADVPGANMDLERFRLEALEPTRAGQSVAYRPYSCQQGTYLPSRPLPVKALTVAEGSYCQHPILSGQYDMKIFLTCSPDAQRSRLQAREGDYFAMFERRWIPLEEEYLRRYDIQALSTLTVDTSEFF